MRIGIIGAGHIGGTLARLFVEAGHDVVIANSRGPETLQDLVRPLGQHACAGAAAEAARFGDVVVVSIPFGHIDELPKDELRGKIVIDTNNYYPDRDGHLRELDEHRATSSELLRAKLDGARVVKAFNSLPAALLAERGRPPGARDRVAIPISGDSVEAKQIVARLVDQVGFDTVDAGRLRSGGRRHQPGTAAYTQALPENELRDRLGLCDEAPAEHPGP